MKTPKKKPASRWVPKPPKVQRWPELWWDEIEDGPCILYTRKDLFVTVDNLAMGEVYLCYPDARHNGKTYSFICELKDSP
jgi:hypothetical protein